MGLNAICRRDHDLWTVVLLLICYRREAEIRATRIRGMDMGSESGSE
jgi:hypothetical protein